MPDDISLSKLQHLLDSLLTIVFTLDINGQFTYINQSCIDVLGYAPHELTGNHCIEFVIEDDQAKTNGFLEQLASGQPVIHFENHFTHKDGRIIPISWAARWDPNDAVYYCAVRDITERKQMVALRKKHQMELEWQNQEMSNMLERMTDGFFIMDLQWRVLFANRQALSIVNCAFEQIYMKTLWESFPFTQGSIFETQYKKAVAEQTPVHFEAYYPEPLQMWMEISAYPSKDSLVVYFRDINERKRLEKEREAYEQKIEAQNQRYRKILERITDGFLAVDRNWTITFSNLPGEKILGMPHGQMQSKNLWECFPKAKGTILENNLQKALTEQVSICFEAYSTVGPMLLEFSVYPSDQGLTIFYRDITEKRKTEDAIQKLSIIAKETNNAITLVEQDGTISWINNAYTKITGYPAEEVIGQRNSELLIGDETNLETVQQFKEYFIKGEPCQGEVLAYTKTKQKVWLSISGQPINEQQGGEQRYFFLMSDITEQKRLEEKLELQRKKTTSAVLAAQEKERSFVGQELHDNVNQILTTVKLYTELIRDGIGNVKELSGKSVQLLQNCINEIRSLSKRLSAPSMENTRFKDSIQDLIGCVTATDKLRIVLDIDHVDSVSIDPELQLAIYRILQEHLTNILKHAVAQRVQIVFKNIDGHVEMVVKDDGKGFDVKKKRKGIGITNMTTRAENLNGTLAVNSAPGLGCELVARFPV